MTDDLLFTMLGELYGTETEKIAWLDSPQPLLGNRVPSTLVRTDEGYRECCAVLRAVLDGAYL